MEQFDLRDLQHLETVETAEPTRPPPPPPRVYQMRAEEVFSAPTVIGTIHIHDTPVRILFDTGAPHCFISLECVQRLGLEPSVCDCFVVGLPDGSRVKCSLELLECPIRIAERVWPADLIVMDLSREDLILVWIG